MARPEEQAMIQHAQERLMHASEELVREGVEFIEQDDHGITFPNMEGWGVTDMPKSFIFTIQSKLGTEVETVENVPWSLLPPYLQPAAKALAQSMSVE